MTTTVLRGYAGRVAFMDHDCPITKALAPMTGDEPDWPKTKANLIGMTFADPEPDSTFMADDAPLVTHGSFPEMQTAADVGVISPEQFDEVRRAVRDRVGAPE